MAFDEPDDYMSDPEGRFDIETLFWYDGPLLWGTRDRRTKVIRLYVTVDPDECLAYSGIISEHNYQRLLDSKLKLDAAWLSLKDYRQHIAEDGCCGPGTFLSDAEAHAAEPLGNCYLGIKDG